MHSGDTCTFFSLLAFFFFFFSFLSSPPDPSPAPASSDPSPTAGAGAGAFAIAVPFVDAPGSGLTAAFGVRSLYSVFHSPGVFSLFRPCLSRSPCDAEGQEFQTIGPCTAQNLSSAQVKSPKNSFLQKRLKRPYSSGSPYYGLRETHARANIQKFSILFRLYNAKNLFKKHRTEEKPQNAFTFLILAINK